MFQVFCSFSKLVDLCLFLGVLLVDYVELQPSLLHYCLLPEILLSKLRHLFQKVSVVAGLMSDVILQTFVDCPQFDVVCVHLIVQLPQRDY